MAELFVIGRLVLALVVDPQIALDRCEKRFIAKRTAFFDRTADNTQIRLSLDGRPKPLDGGLITNTTKPNDSEIAEFGPLSVVPFG